MEFQLNKYNPLNLNYEFPKTCSKKFETIELDLIDACQLKCPMCLRQERSNKKFSGSLDLEALKYFFNDIKKYELIDIKLVRLIGTLSEPTLYPNLLELISFINSNGASVQISTNGNLIDRTFWEELKEVLNTNPQNELLFAIEGSNQEIYSKYRIKGNLNTVITNLKNCSYNRKFKLGWQFIKFQHNVNDFEVLNKELNDYIDFIEEFNCNEPEDYTSEILPRNDILTKFYKKRKHINDELFSNQKTIITNDMIGCVSKQFGELFISTDGNIWPCTNLYENKMDAEIPNIYKINEYNLIECLNKIINQRYKNQECFKACSQFGHKLEKQFLRRRIDKEIK